MPETGADCAPVGFVDPRPFRRPGVFVTDHKKGVMMAERVAGQGFSAAAVLDRIVWADTVAEVSSIVRRLTDDQVFEVISVARSLLIEAPGREGD
jgi:hypothetical protein